VRRRRAQRLAQCYVFGVPHAPGGGRGARAPASAGAVGR
jgi:hypothetical protein